MRSVGLVGRIFGGLLGPCRGTGASMSSLYIFQLQNGYTVRFDSHSHPRGYEASPNDDIYKETLTEIFKRLKAHVPKFSIYKVPQKKEVLY